jgi:ribosomal protein S18 acetylase RimI-like enzyme
VGIDVREARPDEYDEAGRVTAEAYREFVRPESGWRDYLGRIADVRTRAAFTTILVAVEHGQVLGSATLELSQRIEPEDDPPLPPGEAEVRMLGVDPAKRGRGIGAALLAACEDRARDAGKAVLRLHTTQRMLAAQRMYESHGYERTEDRVFPDGFVLLGYRKRL